ncbi:hypothetical protein J7M22_00755, partial [Candidatus Poribacteria bacterium]|nr:hypothetical protein [Candidatus Poribacteria bacterium]
SRGLGLGHATRDLAIAREVTSLRKDVELKFISYASGAEFLKDKPFPLTDLNLPAIGKDGERIFKITEVIGSESPDLIVTDEELHALPIARGFNIPSVLITNWFQADDPEVSALFELADMIIVPDYKEGFHMTLTAKDRILWTGPIWTKETEPTEENRRRARQELDIPPSVKLILLMHGAGDVMDIPFLERAAKAYQLLEIPSRLMIFAGKFHEMFKHLEERGNIQVMGYTERLDPYILAADLAITRGGHTSLWELAMAGIPAIAIPRPKHISPMNEIYAKNMEWRGTAMMIQEEELAPELLKEKMELILTDERIWRKMSKAGREYSISKGASVAAQAILTLAEVSHAQDR